MSRSSPPRQWYPPPQGAPLNEWFNRPDQPPRGRTPPRKYSPRPISPHGERPQRQISPHPESKHSMSPRNERPQSPRNDQQGIRRPISPIRPPSPKQRDRLPSPRRVDRPPSPNRERQYSPRRERYSPRRDRPRSPHNWRPRSPPRPYFEYSRGRSPPPWARRSPPRYGPPSGRSPPRSYWPPPPEWSRYPSPYPTRRSPPRWGPPPPNSHDRRWGPPPPGPPQPDRPYPARKPELRARSPPLEAENAKQDRKYEVGQISFDQDDKDEEVELVDLAPYDPDVAVGQKYVVAVSGFFCKVCHKFYNSESSAKITHCKTKIHYDKFAKWLSEKKVEALMKQATKPVENEGEPPAKQIKLELESEDKDTSDTTGSKYDPTQPTVDVVKEEPVENEEPPPVETTQEDMEGESNLNGTADDIGSESEALITSDVKKDSDDYVEATLFNLRKLKVNQLKANLEKRGMKCTGLKPLLLKRLEKVLADEAAVAAAESEQIAEEESKTETKQEADAKTGCDDSTVGVEYEMKMLESDVELANHKSQWITIRELERELLQLEGVSNVLSMKSERTRLFNGRRTNVEWSIRLIYNGELTEKGLQFSIPSHQKLPFVIMPVEDEEAA